MCEAEVIIKMQKGDYSAFDEIFYLYKDKAVRTAYLITGNKFTSEDVVQEAFILCCSKIKTLKNPELFKPWFFKIVTRLSWKHSNSSKRVTPVENIFEKAEENSENPLQSSFKAFEKEEYEELYRCIDMLDKKSRITVILFYFNEFSIKEISEIMGCFQGTVKSRLFNSRKKLKRFLNDFSKECENDEILKYVRP